MKVLASFAEVTTNPSKRISSANSSVKNCGRALLLLDVVGFSLGGAGVGFSVVGGGGAGDANGSVLSDFAVRNGASEGGVLAVLSAIGSSHWASDVDANGSVLSDCGVRNGASEGGGLAVLAALGVGASFAGL